ncbi:aldo/keto reductase [Anaerolineales bacterium HSG6]|nr:aldo/keto reductase [Anaerolineales bacterium HSG6]MDM8530624.1 aldo/keto reductase [Anaerolineales bacterium HSG25]
MKYRELADTGILVSELCFGTMTFGGRGFWTAIGTTPQDEVNQIVNHCLEAGINFFDTANVYSFGLSEEMLGVALEGKRQDVVIATKVRGRMGDGANQVGLSRVHIMNEVHASLKRLNTDYIDLYQIHGFDTLTNMETTLRTLDDLVRSGKVRHIGCSNLAAWQLMKALGISEFRNLERFVSIQSYYSVAGRDLEREIVPVLKDQNVGLLVWSPLAGGFLSGKFTREGQDDEARRANFDFPPIEKERAYNCVEAMQEIATNHEVSIAQVALGWLLHQDVVTSVIIGAKRMEQLEDNLKAVDLELSADELAKLDEVSQLPPEYPGWMIGFQNTNRRPEELAQS